MIGRGVGSAAGTMAAGIVTMVVIVVVVVVVVVVRTRMTGMLCRAAIRGGGR